MKYPAEALGWLGSMELSLGLLLSCMFRSEMTLTIACFRSFVRVVGLGVMLWKLNFGFVWFLRMNEVCPSDRLPSSLKILDVVTRILGSDENIGSPLLNFPVMEITRGVPSGFFASFCFVSKIYVSLHST